MIFGLTVTEEIATNLGALKGCLLRYRGEPEYLGLNAEGLERHCVIIEFYESKAKYLDGDQRLIVLAENKRTEIAVKAGTELTETIIYEHLKTPLADVYTLADEEN